MNDKWDIVLLSYPFTDLSGVKVRPALILSPTSYNQTGQDAVFILITTNTTRQSSYDIIVSKSHPEFNLTGLRYDSAIRTDKLFALNKKLIKMALGRAGQQLQSEVEKQLRLFLDLPGAQMPLNI